MSNYRDSVIIMFRDKNTDQTYCRLCLKSINTPDPVFRCNRKRCVCSYLNKTVCRPFFDNSKHEIILSVDKCFLCSSCSVGNNPQKCREIVREVVNNCIENIRNSARET